MTFDEWLASDANIVRFWCFINNGNNVGIDSAIACAKYGWDAAMEQQNVFPTRVGMNRV